MTTRIFERALVCTSNVTENQGGVNNQKFIRRDDSGTWCVKFPLLIVMISVVLLASCTEAPIDDSSVPQRVGTIQSRYLAERLMDRVLLENLGDVIPAFDKKDNPDPIPARLLVKIDPSETATRFTLEGRDEDCDLRILKEHDLIHRTTSIASARYVGVSQSGNAAIRLDLKKPTNFSQLQRMYTEKKLTITRPFPPVEKAGVVKSVLLELEPRILRKIPQLPCRTPYYQLKEDSDLNRVFRKLGVQSIRRVFRNTEQVDRANPGIYRVLKVDDLLMDIQQRFPQRTARAYPDVAVPPNMENWFLLRLKPGVKLVGAVRLLKRTTGIEKVSADYPILAAQYPPQFPNQWGLKNTGQTGGTSGMDINIETAWQDTAPSQQPIVMAIIDSGFKEDLDQLSGRLWTNTAETPGNGVDDDCNGYVDDVHGMTAYDPWAIIYSGAPCTVHPGGPSEPFTTHGSMVAGVAAADHAGTNPNAIAGTAGTQDVRLMNLVVGNCEANSPLASGTAEIGESLYYAIAEGADIANISLSGYGSYPAFLEDSVQLALANGLIIIASAGNDGRPFTKSGNWSFATYPASMQGVIAVGGVNHFGHWWPESNYGPGLDLVAPAKNIRTITYADPAQTVADFVDADGTSFSAPFTSGTAAIVLAKYGYVTALYMRHWLRATARDITDPLNTGANLVGDDEWTGAGLLDAGTATVALADPNDQPINVDILVERLRSGHYSDYVGDAVAGSPDLGITVTTPAICIGLGGQNNCLKNWRLEYGEGDAPTIWFPINIANPSVTTNSIDVARSGSPYFRRTEVASGANYLNTDLLTNNTLYTIRLVAESNASPPREFVAYDWIIPTRAKLVYPGKQISIVGRWGWRSLWGFTDIRNNANYRISFSRDDGTLLWNSPFFYPAQRFSDPAFNPNSVAFWGTSASAFMELMGKFSANGSVLLPPSSANPATVTEGWVKFELNVQTETGTSETDEVRLYLDNSHFPYETNWPQDLYTDAWRTGYAQESVTVADMGGTIGSRIFFHSRSNFVCYDANGTFLWKIGNLHRTWTDAFSPMGNGYDLPDFAVEDVDNDGTKEVVVAGSAFDPTTNKASLFVHLLKADGSSFSSNWPRVFPNYIDLSKMQYIPKIHVADISGNADKEIIFYRKPLYYYGIPVADIRGGELHAVGLNAQDVWTMSFPPEQTRLPLDVADVDNDGKDEILLEPDRILEGNGTFKAGWATEANPGFRAKLVDLDLATPELEVLMYQAWWTSYELTVLDHNGVEISGWPATITTNITYDFGDPRPRSPVVTVGQASAGGDPEVIVCDDSIRVLGSDGQPIASRPDINISGRCMGMRLVDLDGDNSLDTYIVLVERAKVGVPADFRRGNFLEAYQLDGTRLAGGGRWPIVADGENFRTSGHSGEIYWNGSVTVGDIDGDNSLEAIHLLRLLTEPPQTLPRNDTRIEVLDIQ